MTSHSHSTNQITHINSAKTHPSVQDGPGVSVHITMTSQYASRVAGLHILQSEHDITICHHHHQSQQHRKLTSQNSNMFSVSMPKSFTLA